MLRKSILGAAAWFEIVVGAIFLIVPDVPCRLLFAAAPEDVGVVPLARFAGVALVTLGIACLPFTTAGPRRGAALVLLAFNVGVAALFTWVGVATTPRGLLLWPAAVLHTVIAAALLPRATAHHPSSEKLRTSVHSH
jgi:hypothetical protein